MADVNLSWSGVDVTVTDEYLDETRVSVRMEQSRAFRDWRVPRALELAQRNLDAIEGNDASEETQAMLAMAVACVGAEILGQGRHGSHQRPGLPWRASGLQIFETNQAAMHVNGQ